MIYFAKYAEEKFDRLHKYKLFLTKEQVEEVIKLPDKTGKKNGYLTARKDDLKVIYKNEDGTAKVITFFPVKK